MDAHTGNLLNSLETQDQDFFDLRWGPGPDRLIWLASDDKLRIWDPVEDVPIEIDTGSVIDPDIVEGGPASYTSDAALVAISGWKYLTDGDATTGSIRPLMMMDVAAGKALYTLEDIGLYSFVTFSPDGSLLITGSSIRNSATGVVLRTLEDYPSSDQSFTFSPDGTMFSAVSTADTIKYKVFIWDVATGPYFAFLMDTRFVSNNQCGMVAGWKPDRYRFNG